MNHRQKLKRCFRKLLGPTAPITNGPRPLPAFVPRRARPPIRLLLETLENRWLPAPMTFLVKNTNNTGADSLQQAILDANANPGLDTIQFQIAPASVQTISPIPAQLLPQITSPLFLDGDAPAGFAGQVIVLNGASAGGVSGLDFEAGSDGSTVQGLVIQKFGVDGILLNGTSGNLIVGNKIGTDVFGTAVLGNTQS